MSRVLMAGSLIVGLSLFLGCSPEASTQESTTGEPTGQAANTDKMSAALAKLSDADRQCAVAQQVCPVTGEPLGSMGKPIKVVDGERELFVCCAGCEEEAKANFDAMFAKVNSTNPD